MRICEYLVEHGARIDVKNERGRTPLHLAALHNNYDVCKFLIEHGASTQAKDENGETPVQMVWDNSKLIEYLNSVPVSELESADCPPKAKSEKRRKSLRCPECGAKFVRVQRSAAAPFSALSPSTDVHGEQLRIPFNHSASSSNSPYLFHVSGLLTIVQLLLKIGNRSPVYSLVAEDCTLWSPKTILASRMDPLAEEVIKEIPSFEETYTP